MNRRAALSLTLQSSCFPTLLFAKSTAHGVLHSTKGKLDVVVLGDDEICEGIVARSNRYLGASRSLNNEVLVSFPAVFP